MEVVLDGENGRRLVLSDLLGPEDNQRYTAVLSMPQGGASVTVWEYRTGLPAFMRELASAWRGFDGAREYSTLEGELRLSFRHDGLGKLACKARLCQPWPPEWSMELELDVGAGAHLERLADDVEAFFARSE